MVGVSSGAARKIVAHERKRRDETRKSEAGGYVYCLAIERDGIWRDIHVHQPLALVSGVLTSEGHSIQTVATKIVWSRQIQVEQFRK